MAPYSAGLTVNEPIWRRVFAMTRFRLRVLVLLGCCCVAYVLAYVLSLFLG